MWTRNFFCWLNFMVWWEKVSINSWYSPLHFKQSQADKPEPSGDTNWVLLPKKTFLCEIANTPKSAIERQPIQYFAKTYIHDKRLLEPSLLTNNGVSELFRWNGKIFFRGISHDRRTTPRMGNWVSKNRSYQVSNFERSNLKYNRA